MLDRNPEETQPTLARDPVLGWGDRPAAGRRASLDVDLLAILVVSGRAPLVSELRTMLAGDGQFSVASAPTLSSAERQLEGSRPDAVLIDLGSASDGDLTGLERILAAAPGLPVIALDRSELAGATLERGAQDHLPTLGLERETLRRAVRHSIRRQRVRNDHDSMSGELRKANARLAELALVDPLTALLNRRGLQQMLTRELRWARRDCSELALFLVDLDDFRRINDSFGHTVGDVVLREVAGTLRDSLRGTDYLARIGGDEFMVLLPQTRLGEALRVAEKVRRSLANTPVAARDGSVHVTASVGVTLVVNEGVSVDELWSLTHQRLREGRGRGPNRVCGPEGAPAPVHARDGRSEPELTELLRSGSFLRMARQPILDLAEMRVVGYELLARSDEPSLGGPLDFFQLAFECGVLPALDRRCAELAIAEGLRLPQDLGCFVNVLPSTLIDVPVQHFVELCTEDPRPGRFCVEISEQQIIGDPSYLRAAVETLRGAGIRIAIDDVGFGRSCLESLVMLEPDLIKLDRRCVRGIDTSGEQRRSLERLLRVAATLEAGVIAEGIETEADLATLIDLGVPLGQGYHFGLPS